MQNDRQSMTTLRKRHDADTAFITVELRIEEGPFCITSDFEHPVDLQPTAKCRQQYSTTEQLFRACEGAAQSGVFYATRSQREKCGRVVFTKFGGKALPPDCGIGFATAAAVACFDALGQRELANQMDMQGWEEI